MEREITDRFELLASVPKIRMVGKKGSLVGCKCGNSACDFAVPFVVLAVIVRNFASGALSHAISAVFCFNQWDGHGADSC